MLNNKPLKQHQNQNGKSIFNSKVYKEYLLLKPNELIVTITLFSDGVKVFNSSKTEIWPVFIRIEDLDCSLDDKTLLYSCFHGKSKPNVETYIDELINSLIKLYSEGIYIEKLNCKVYVLLLVNLFDTPARHLFLNHASHKGYFSCTICKIKGIRKGHYQLFKPQKKIEFRNRESYLNSLSTNSANEGIFFF